MFDWLADPNAWIALATLTALEIVLGIDNIIFISILVGRVPAARRDLARRLGLGLAMGTRIALLLSLSWIMQLREPLFTLYQRFSGRDLILIGGGCFLLWTATVEIHQSISGELGDNARAAASISFMAAIGQIMVIDIVFSLDSIITAVGMVDRIEIMIAAVVASVGLMMLFAAPIGRFVSDHPTIKMLALAFLVVVAVILIAEGFDQHVPKGYIYFAMAFSVAVEALNIRMRRRSRSTTEIRP